MRRNEIYGKWEADDEFREKYYIPHPPSTVYKRWEFEQWGTFWGISALLTDKEKITLWEWCRDAKHTGRDGNSLVKPQMRKLPHSTLTIDWCTVWGLSSIQLAYCSDQVLAYETVSDTYTVAKHNIATQPTPPGKIDLQLQPTDTQNLNGAISSVPWHLADIIRIGSRSASYILQSIRSNIRAHTIITEIKDPFLQQLTGDMGYTRLPKQNCIVWRKNK